MSLNMPKNSKWLVFERFLRKNAHVEPVYCEDFEPMYCVPPCLGKCGNITCRATWETREYTRVLTRLGSIKKSQNGQIDRGKCDVIESINGQPFEYIVSICTHHFIDISAFSNDATCIIGIFSWDVLHEIRKYSVLWNRHCFTCGLCVVYPARQNSFISWMNHPMEHTEMVNAVYSQLIDLPEEAWPSYAGKSHFERCKFLKGVSRYLENDVYYKACFVLTVYFRQIWFLHYLVRMQRRIAHVCADPMTKQGRRIHERIYENL